MRKRIRRVCAVAAMLIAGTSFTAIPAKADTTDYYFNLQVNTSDISKRTLKAGGSVYEKCFYVRPTYFSKNVRYHGGSFLLDTHSQYGVDITISPSDRNKLLSCSYYKDPPSGKYYYLLVTYDAAATSGPSVYVEGRFTP